MLVFLNFWLFGEQYMIKNQAQDFFIVLCLGEKHRGA